MLSCTSPESPRYRALEITSRGSKLIVLILMNIITFVMPIGLGTTTPTLETQSTLFLIVNKQENSRPRKAYNNNNKEPALFRASQWFIQMKKHSSFNVKTSLVFMKLFWLLLSEGELYWNRFPSKSFTVCEWVDVKSNWYSSSVFTSERVKHFAFVLTWLNKKFRNHTYVRFR